MRLYFRLLPVSTRVYGLVPPREDFTRCGRGDRPRPGIYLPGRERESGRRVMNSQSAGGNYHLVSVQAANWGSYSVGSFFRI
jgi:hypothetical protein